MMEYRSNSITLLCFIGDSIPPLYATKILILFILRLTKWYSRDLLHLLNCYEVFYSSFFSFK